MGDWGRGPAMRTGGRGQDKTKFPFPKTHRSILRKITIDLWYF